MTVGDTEAGRREKRRIGLIKNPSMARIFPNFSFQRRIEPVNYCTVKEKILYRETIAKVIRFVFFNFPKMNKSLGCPSLPPLIF